MNKLKQKLGVLWFAILWTCVGLLLLAALFVGLFNWVRNAPLHQQAAGWWQSSEGEGRFAQVSTFFGAQNGFALESMMKLRQDVAAKLVENSMAAEEGTRLWLDAYSGQKNLSVSTTRASAEVAATGVGGDFFFLHPYDLMSGQYLQTDIPMDDVVLIDWDLAWRLYGAYDVVGFPITVGGKPCYVGGVLRKDADWPQSKAYGETSRIFMSYDMLNSIDSSVSITCVELILPNPISGFAMGIVEELVPAEETGTVLVENSDRYSLLTLLKKVKDFGAPGHQTALLPYWESAAQTAEAYGLLFLALTALTLLFPLVIVGSLLVKAWKRKGVAIHKLMGWGKKKIAQLRQKKIGRTQKEAPVQLPAEEVQEKEEEEAQV